MRTILLTAALLTSLTAASALTANEVAELSKAGVGDNVIIAQLETDGTRAHLSADTILRLQGEGVSDEVILAMIRSGSKPAATPTRPSLTEQRRALDRAKAEARAEQQTTFVQTYTPLYTPAPYGYGYSYPCQPQPQVQWSYRIGQNPPMFVNGSPGVYGSTVSRPCPPRIDTYRPPHSGITIIVRSRDEE